MKHQAVTMVWLLWFGVRKRSYASRGAPLRGWLSAHLYLGVALVLWMLLHSAFQFGWNLHTAAFALAVLTIATGVFGLWFYNQVPSPMTRNRPGQKIDGLLAQVADLDARSRTAASSLPDVFAQAVEHSIQETRFGGGLLEQLLTRVPAAALQAQEQIREAPRAGMNVAANERVQEVVELLAIKHRLLTRIARDRHYKALLDLWLVAHVPLACTAVVAVAVHVFVVFYYR